MTLAVYLADPARADDLAQLVTQYSFVQIAQLPESGHVLVLDAQRLSLHSCGRGAPGPVFVDFAGGASDWRRKHGGGRGQGVARACGLKGGATPHVLDATAGLGRDAFVLATLGCRVDMIERSPIAAALLEDGLKRARQSAELADIVGRMQLWHGDAAGLMQAWPASAPEVVYLDPMFPDTRQKSALSKKDMQAFQQVIGADIDADALLAPARALALGRVAVKRPRHAPYLADARPGFSLEGDSVRYDCYAATGSAGVSLPG
ncbi:class I SAM-dependent methyltransferase [Chitinimonas sp.]|uniref:class I SAM-dependent methyltransferase n=1 Tax=Chitinimonas sp. TaxID=1934313 RepID=UPI0035B32155